MTMRRVLISRSVCRAAGLVALGLVPQAGATNLLVNPGFEAPADPGNNVDSLCTGWTFQFSCQRANFHVNENPTGGTRDIWAKTFDPLGGGVIQNVSGISAGTNYTLSTQNYFETTYNTTSAFIELGLIWMNASNQPV